MLFNTGIKKKNKMEKHKYIKKCNKKFTVVKIKNNVRHNHNRVDRDLNHKVNPTIIIKVKSALKINSVSISHHKFTINH